MKECRWFSEANKRIICHSKTNYVTVEKLVNQIAIYNRMVYTHRTSHIKAADLRVNEIGPAT